MVKRVKLLILGLILSLTMVLWGDPAFSHAVLLQTAPADGAALDIPPAEVVLTFNEQVQITQLQVLDNRGDPVHQGEIEGRNETGRIALAPDLAEGIYTVTWRAISVDSHPVRGSFVFGVGLAESLLPEQVETVDPWRVWGALVRLGTYGGSLLGIGILWFRREQWVLSLLLLAGLATVAASLVQTLQIYGDLSGIPAVLTSAYGFSAGIRLLGLVSLAISRIPIGLGSVLVLGSFSLMGHGAAAGSLAMGLLVLHLAGSGFWLGGLVDILHNPVDPVRVRRFSDRATWIVPGLIMAGLGLGAIHIGIPVDLTPLYSQIAALKLGLVVALVGLGAHNKFRLVPALLRGTEVALERLRSIVKAELLTLVMVLALTTLLVEQPPPSHAHHHGHHHHHRECQAEMVLQTHQVQMTVIPCQPGVNEIELKVIRDGIPAEHVQEATLRFSMPQRDIAPIRRQTTLTKPGVFTWSGQDLSQAGTWEIELSVLVSDFEQERGWIPLFL